MAGRRNDEWRGPGTGDLRELSGCALDDTRIRATQILGLDGGFDDRDIELPDGVTGFLVQRDDKASVPRTEIEEAQTAVENKGRGVAPLMHLPAQVAAPQLAPVEVVAMDARRAKPGDDTVSIGHGRRSARR